jgi:hypothetical protein
MFISLLYCVVVDFVSVGELRTSVLEVLRLKKSSVFTLAIAAGAAVLSPGCSSGWRGATAMLPGSDIPQARAHLLGRVSLPSGIDARFGPPKHVPAQLVARPDAKRIERDLFVSGLGDKVFVLNRKAYEKVGAIKSGIDGPDGLFVDKKGNVYIANYASADVTEYKKGQGSPVCTYSSGLVDPIDVTVDDAGNVYVADYNDDRAGWIDVFPQCSNTMSKQYDVAGGGPEGVAVDASGDIFVAYFGPTDGQFVEFVAGSSSPTQLGATVASPGGLILDKSGNLIADDQSGAVVVIAPPYSAAKVLASGLSDPFHCSLNKSETLLFNANAGSATVTVYSYPSGALVTTIGRRNGINAAEGVGDSPDAVF